MGLDSLVLGFLGLEYWACIPGFGILRLQSWAWITGIAIQLYDIEFIPGFDFLGLESWAWIPGLGFLGLEL